MYNFFGAHKISGATQSPWSERSSAQNPTMMIYDLFNTRNYSHNTILLSECTNRRPQIGSVVSHIPQPSFLTTRHWETVLGHVGNELCRHCIGVFPSVQQIYHVDITAARMANWPIRLLFYSQTHKYPETCYTFINKIRSWSWHVDCSASPMLPVLHGVLKTTKSLWHQMWQTMRPHKNTRQ